MAVHYTPLARARGETAKRRYGRTTDRSNILALRTLTICCKQSHREGSDVLEHTYMAKGGYQDADFLEFVVKSLVDNPGDVKVDRKVDEMGVLLTLKVSPQDMGQVIGRNGNTAKAIRSLLRVVGIKNNARVNLKIEEPEGGRGPRPSMERRSSVDEVVDDLKL